jgi:hypothetical protein
MSLLPKFLLKIVKAVPTSEEEAGIILTSYSFYDINFLGRRREEWDAISI